MGSAAPPAAGVIARITHIFRKGFFNHHFVQRTSYSAYLHVSVCLSVSVCLPSWIISICGPEGENHVVFAYCSSETTQSCRSVRHKVEQDRYTITPTPMPDQLMFVPCESYSLSSAPCCTVLPTQGRLFTHLSVCRLKSKLVTWRVAGCLYFSALGIQLVLCHRQQSEHAKRYGVQSQVLYRGHWQTDGEIDRHIDRLFWIDGWIDGWTKFQMLTPVKSTGYIYISFILVQFIKYVLCDRLYMVCQ